MVLDEDDNGVVSYNQYDLPVSEKLEDNSLQTIEQLKEKYPNMEFTTPLEYGEESFESPENVPPYMVYLTDSFFESNPDCNTFDKVEYADYVNAHVEGSTLMIGRKVVDPTSPGFYRIRETTQPTQILRHECEHRKDILIEEGEEILLVENIQGVNELIERRNAIIGEIEELVDKSSEYDPYTRKWGKSLGESIEKGRELNQINYQINEMFYEEEAENHLLRYKYNWVANNTLENFFTSPRTEEFIEDINADLEEDYVNRAKEIVEFYAGSTEEYLNSRRFEKFSNGVDIYNRRGEKRGYASDDIGHKERTRLLLEEDPYKAYKNILESILYETDTWGQTITESILDVLNPFEVDIYFHEPDYSIIDKDGWWQVEAQYYSDDILSQLRSNSRERNVRGLESLYTSGEEFEKEIDVLFRSEGGLASLYSLHNYGKIGERIFSGSYLELPSTYREIPVEERAQLVQSANKNIRETFTTLTQLAFDSGKMDAEEYKAIMGEKSCKQVDCSDKLCVEYKLLCCIEHPNSPNCQG